MAIGSTLTAVVMIFGIFSLLPTAIVAAETTSYGVFGHATINILDKDGNMKSYIQTDNIPLDHLKNCSIDNGFGTVLAAINVPAVGPVPGPCNIINRMAIGDSGGAFIALTDNVSVMSNEYTNTGRCTTIAVAATAATVVAQPTQAATGGVTGEPAAVTLRCSNVAGFGNNFVVALADVGLTAGVPVGSGAACVDVNGDTIKECPLSEVAIFDSVGAGTMYARSTFGPNTVTAGDIVNMDYQVTIQ